MFVSETGVSACDSDEGVRLTVGPAAVQILVLAGAAERLLAVALESISIVNMGAEKSARAPAEPTDLPPAFGAYQACLGDALRTGSYERQTKC